jgi:hypothetical protein
MSRIFRCLGFSLVEERLQETGGGGVERLLTGQRLAGGARPGQRREVREAHGHRDRPEGLEP